MKLGDQHLCYCTNIHAGESLAEVSRALVRWTPGIKARVAPGQLMGIGLRLSRLAADELSDPKALRAFQVMLDTLGLYVFTINGFPYGPFHGTAVKETVYDPDWTTKERVDYTRQLVLILSQLMPDGCVGSISTVPGCFSAKDTSESRHVIIEHLIELAIDLARLRGTTGREICLALEPEPECMLETSQQVVLFFKELRDQRRLQQVESALGVRAEQARAILSRHLGVCVDVCHAAVEFEEAATLISALERADIRIAKLQLSCGLRVASVTEASLRELAQFNDPVYLHQTVVADSGQLRRYLDLPLALTKEKPSPQSEWRVHFHVPIFLQELGAFSSTQTQLVEFLGRQRDAPFTTHLEVETYTWDVLPAELRQVELDEAIARELNWVVDSLRGVDPSRTYTDPSHTFPSQ